MKKYTKLIALLLALVMVFSVLSACAAKDDETPGGTSDPTQTPSTGNNAPSGGDNNAPPAPGGNDPAPSGGEGTPAGDYSLIIGSTVKNDTFDFRTYTDNPTQIRMCYEYLVDVLPSGELEFMLAENIEYVDEYTVKVTLRPDVYFTHGQPLTANDVMETYKAWAEFGRESTFWETFDWDNCYIEDDHTLYFAFNSIYGPAISYMSCWAIFQADDIANYTADQWVTDPNGTGPYLCTENIVNSSISYELKAPEDYWGELPAAKTVTYKYYSDTSALYIDFETGALDAAFGLNAMDADRVLNGDCPANTGYSLVSAKDVTRIQLCDTTAVFADERVREALCLAVDVAGLSVANYGPLWKEATSTITTNVQFYENVGVNEYDPERAKELLTEAGYGEGDITLKLLVSPDNQVLAEALQAYYDAVGVELIVESYDIGTLIPMWMNGESDILIGETIDGAYFSDPVNVFANYSPTSRNACMALTDPEWVEAYNLATNNVDAAKRAEGYSIMQNFVVDTHRMINVCERVRMLVWNSDVISEFPLGNPSNPTCLDVVFAY